MVASEMYSFTQKQYGYAGMLFINQLIKKHSYNNYEEIKRLYGELKEEIRNRCPNINYAQLSYIALVTTADVLIGKLYFKTDKESSIKMAENIVENISRVVSKDVVDNAYDYISEWILSNLSRFDKWKDENNVDLEDIVASSSRSSELFGIYEKDVFYIFPYKFDSRLEQQGFNPDKVKQGFKDRGYIITDDDVSITTKIIYKGEKREFIGVKVKNTIEAREKQVEEYAEKTFLQPPIDEEALGINLDIGL